MHPGERNINEQPFVTDNSIQKSELTLEWASRRVKRNVTSAKKYKYIFAKRNAEEFFAYVNEKFIVHYSAGPTRNICDLKSSDGNMSNKLNE